MVNVTFNTGGTASRTVRVAAGQSLMAVATAHDIPNIVAECGGTATCGTCHVWVDPIFADMLPALSAREADVLDGVIAERKPGSRLACQIQLTESLDGLRVEVPDAQW